MTYLTILPVWNGVRERFIKKVNTLTTEDLSLSTGPMTIGELLYHTAEVEFMFVDWFFGVSMPKDVVKTNRDDLEELLRLLHRSNEHLIKAMKECPEKKWHAIISTRIGESTPLEAIGRLIYHTGIHVGQISTIQKMEMQN